MNIFRFENPDYLYALLALPILIIVWFIVIRIQKKSLLQLGDIELINKLMPGLSYKRKNLRFTIFIFALASLIIAISNPQIGSKLEKVKRKGIDMIIAVDISNSMLAEDIKPNRLTSSKRAISKLVDNLQGDRIGIIVFAGSAYTQLPITTDYSAAKMFLSTVSTDYISTQGTSIAAAIDMGRITFENEAKAEKNLERNKAIVVITDGEDHEEGAIEQAKKASEEGIKVYTIGMGTLRGAPIPNFKNGRRTGYKKDKDGHTVISKFNESLLKEIADEGDGIYVRADNSKSGLKLILDEINMLNKTEIETQTFKDYESRFQIFAALSILLLIIEIILFDKKSKFQISKIFDRKENN